MIRTQIYLTPKQHSGLKKKAVSLNSTISDQIRRIVDEDLEGGEKSQPFNTGKWLLSMAKEAEKMGVSGPKDLATNVDKYLYGDKD